ncbi:PREDICTED: NHL repeat-containing protein 2 isoform X1 [Polistes dominula]|uniref:NHL repeat-containing protein 2 isoform X1 n=2 Tax=Polistes dominula TaxID=743375 RepID=A0ABM1IGL3_POLDO|nr:PREDICTED: NHL repeat-containing protein 2 isoform X1 [Polistes dominula]
MCGQVNKKMSVSDTVRILTDACEQFRHDFQTITDQTEKQKLVLRHIKTFANTEACVKDFQKGLEWFNVSENLSMKKHLHGKIVILDFFTYCCINCMHILPDLEALEKEFSIERGLVVIGVHSAKFSNERDSTKIRSAVQRYNIMHPVVNDSTLSMWEAIGVMCWPTMIMLGPRGQPLMVTLGEGHREELFLYTKVALDYFTSINEISDHTLPIAPAIHLLPASTDILRFPGKVEMYSSETGEKLIVSDTGNNRILIADINGNIEHVIGRYEAGFKDGSFNEAKFNAPQGTCVLNEMIYVADNENHAIRRIDLKKQTVTTVAGTGKQGHDYIGGKFGTDQAISSPWDVAIYYHNSDKVTVPILLIAIAGTHQIWALFLEDTVWWKNKLYKAGVCAAIVGNGREGNRNNSYPHAATLAQPSGITIAQEYNTVYFADSESSSIREVHLKDGKVSTLCGADKNPQNLHDFGDVDGTRHTAKLQHPLGIIWNSSQQETYIADTYNHKIKKVDPTGNCKTLYGAGKPDKSFIFDEPSGLAINNKADTLYVADTNNHSIKKINLKSNTISTISFILPTKDNDKDNFDEVYTFDTIIDTNGGELTITFDFIFEDGLKLNSEAPQKWSLSLPNDTWIAKCLHGSFTIPTSIQIPKGSENNDIRLILDIITCNVNECIPKKILAVFKVQQKVDGPRTVAEHKKIVIKK